MTIVSSLAVLGMMAAPGADNGKGRKVNSSRTDCVTQAELLMGYYGIDGFGLDAEEYDLLMGLDDVTIDDMTYGFSVATCAGGWNVPTLSAPVKPNGGDDEGDGDNDGNGKGRFGTIIEQSGVGSISRLTDVSGIKIQGGRPGDWTEPIIRPWSIKPDAGGDEGDGDDGNGKGRFGTITEQSGVGSISKLTDVSGIEIQGGRPGGLLEPPIDIIRPWSIKPDGGGDEGDGDNDGNGKGRFGTITEHSGVGSISKLTDVSGIEIQGGRPGGLVEPPIDIIRPWSIKPNGGDDEGDGDNDGNGKGRFGTITEHSGVGSISRLTDVSGIEIQGGRPGGLLEPPIDTIRPWSMKPNGGDDEGDGDNDGKGKGRFGTITEHSGVGSISKLTDVSGIEIQGGRPGGLLDPPIDTIRPW